MSARILFMDDEAWRVQALQTEKILPSAVTHASRVTDAITMLSSQDWDELWFDHDFDHTPETSVDRMYRTLNGKDIAQALVDLRMERNKNWNPLCIVHSTNRFQAPKIAEILKLGGFRVLRMDLVDMIGEKYWALGDQSLPYGSDEMP